jgi:hypothetical protein
MDIRKYLSITVALLSGCTTTARIDFESLNRFQIDCSKKQEQLGFLRSQWPSYSDQLVNGMMITSTLGYVSSNVDGTYQERMKLYNGAYTSVLRLLIYDIQKTCPN